MPFYRFKVKISKSNVDPKSFASLQITWVKIFNLPVHARVVNIVREVASLVGKPIAVDELSLIRDGPVRVRI
jgi:hypothetical protein